jgi:hypothetical protein
MDIEQTKIGIETTYQESAHVEIEYPWADKVSITVSSVGS